MFLLFLKYNLTTQYQSGLYYTTLRLYKTVRYYTIAFLYFILARHITSAPSQNRTSLYRCPSLSYYAIASRDETLPPLYITVPSLHITKLHLSNTDRDPTKPLPLRSYSLYICFAFYYVSTHYDTVP